MKLSRLAPRILLLSLSFSIPSLLRAATFTVGAAGTHATIQAAIDAAIAAPGSDEVRVARGTYRERLEIQTESVADPQALRISGGWDPDFGGRIDDPNLTVIDADRLGRALRVRCAAGEVEVALITLREGRVSATASIPAFGGGALLEAYGCEIALRQSSVIDNLIVSPEDHGYCACGGGIAALISGDGVVELRDNTVAANEARGEAESSNAAGGGIFCDDFVAVPGRSRVRVIGNDIRGNRVRVEGSDSDGDGGGLFLEATSPASEIEVSDNTFFANQVVHANPPFLARGSGVVIGASDCEDCRVEARRNRVLENVGPDLQFGVRCGLTCRALVSDTLVADGDGGLGLLRFPGAAEILASNLTLAGNTGPGLTTEGGGISVSNSILFGNSAPDAIDPTTTLSSNLTTDPLFADTPGGDYHPRLDSPAIDAGDNLPPGGLGPLDLDREERVQGPAVDIGAYESAGRSAGGRSTGVCTVSRFGPLPFVPSWVPACRCLRDDTLRELRCGGIDPGLFADLRIPLPLVPGQPVEAVWTLHPWADFRGGAYRLHPSLLVGTKETPVAIKGKGTGKLGDKDAREDLRFDAPSSPSLLRARVKILLPGLKLPIEYSFQMDVLLEVEDEPKGPN